MENLKAAVIGTGYLGKFHAEKYVNLPDVELFAVCDTNPQTVEEIANKFKVKAYTDYRDLLGKIDAVSIAVPTLLHFAVAKFFLENKVHVLLEKPITSTLQEADTLIAIARQNNTKLQIGHLERFNPALLALQPILGKPKFIESYRIAPFNPRGADVNVILDLMIHDIDLIQKMIASPITSIDASGIPVISQTTDIANARIHFANHAIANVTASRVSLKAERKMRIFQPEAYISIDFQNKTYIVHQRDTGEIFPGIANIKRQEFMLEQGDALYDEIAAFITAIHNNTEPLVTGEDGRNALQTALQITEMVNQQIEMFSTEFI
jgi:predicted dehydrogenase